jgi:hypothetical protein
MAIVYESNLVRTSSSYSGLNIRLGDIVKGSLTSITDTDDVYNLIINGTFLVNLKFNVEQSVNEFDYYILRTPVGSFYIHPNYTKIPSEGINFYISNNTNRFNYIYYDSIDVIGNRNGVLKLGYTLEITELNANLAGSLIEAGSSFVKSPLVRVNQIVSVWDSNDYNYLKFVAPTLPNGSSGILTVKLIEAKDYDNTPSSIPETTINIYNEGQRKIGSGDYENINNYIAIDNVTSGNYYLSFSSYLSYTSKPLLNKYEIGFYEVFSNTKTVAHNSNLEDYFSNWSTRLDTVVYADFFFNYQITVLNTKSGDSGTISVKNKSNAVLDKMDVERVVFSDKTIAYDFSSGESGYKTVMLIGAAFGKEFIPQYFSTGLKYFDSGSSTKSIAKLIVDLNLIEQAIGNYSDSSWVKHVYKNIIGMDPVQSEENYYVNLLKNKTYTRTDLLDMAVTVSNLETRIDLVGLQTNGLVFDTLS